MSKKSEIILGGNKTISMDVVKRAFVTEGMTSEEISEALNIPKKDVDQIIKDLDLRNVRKNLIKSGVKKIEHKQIDQAKSLMNLDISFKKLRLIQLEKQLEDFAAYYATHGDFYKRHPTTDKILKDTNGMPIQIPIPNVAKEIGHIKESLNLSQGLKNLLQHVDDILNTKKEERLDDPEESQIIDMDALFTKR